MPATDGGRLLHVARCTFAFGELGNRRNHLLMRLALWLQVFPGFPAVGGLARPAGRGGQRLHLLLPPNPASAQFLDWERTARHYSEFMGLWLKMREFLPADGWLECRYERNMVASPDVETARGSPLFSASPER